MKKTYVKIVDEKLLSTFGIDESDIVEFISINDPKDLGVFPNYNVKTSKGRELVIIDSQLKSIGNSSRSPLRERILSAGIENCFFYGNYYDDGKFLMDIDEARHKVIDNYKITLRKVGDKESYHHFYISDLDSMIERGQVMFLIKAEK